MNLPRSERGPGGARPRPHVLLLMADQFRADCVGADGGFAPTPNLDRLAAAGALFRRAYTACPSCTPARAGLLTGLTPWRHGMMGYGRLAETYPNEMPRLMREAGYAAVGVGKMHWHPQRNRHGFERTILDESGRVEAPGFESDYRTWFRSQAPELDPDATRLGWNDFGARPYALPEELHPTRWVGDRAVAELRRHDGTRPLFLKVSFARPHSPYDPPGRILDGVTPSAFPRRRLGAWSERHAARGERVPADTWCGDLGEAQTRVSRRHYLASVAFIDEQVGRIMMELEAQGMGRNALVVFTADHGDMLGDHHLWRKTYAYEPSARVPLLVRWPDGWPCGPRGRRVDYLAELCDLLPTFLEAAGAAHEHGRFDGVSLLSLLRGAAQPRDDLILEHAGGYCAEADWNAVTDGRTKYVRFAPTGREQLFDLLRDPYEEHDLSGDPARGPLIAERRACLSARLAPRGLSYVRDGAMVRRPRPILYGPNYPCLR